LLGAPAPRYLHVPMLVEESGERLAKRTGLGTVAELRDRGVRAGRLLAAIARAYGQHCEGSDDRSVVDEVASAFDPARFPARHVARESVEAAL
jgi:glutamyl-tRNA synthetase